MTSAAEFFEYITADQLNSIVDHDIDASEEAGLYDYTSLQALIVQTRPELLEFTKRTVTRLPGFEDFSQQQITECVMGMLTALGAVCRAAELSELPALD